MTSTVLAPAERQANSVAVADYIAPLVAERRANPTDDLISLLVQAEVPADDAADGVEARPLDDDEIATFVRLLIIAGAGTTYRAFGNLLYLLLTHPDQLAEVRADRSLVPAAIEESLRIEQPLAHFGRHVVATSEVCGVDIPADSVVELNVGAANHDPGQWPEPERFDIHRDKPERHLTFGFGAHRCLGIHLARAELTELLERTLDRLPNLRLDPHTRPRSTPPGWSSGFPRPCRVCGIPRRSSVRAAGRAHYLPNTSVATTSSALTAPA